MKNDYSDGCNLLREKEIIVRYLTKDSKLSVAQELVKIVNLLTNTNRELFEEALGLWHEK